LNSLSRKVKNIYINSDIISIGRVAENTVVIADPRLSGKHCKLLRKYEEDGCMVAVLEDLSTNGTFINGEAVSFKFNDLEL
jgi:pSer/pThr/pTyr-binding forkhead associated (FHA) protein